MNHWILNSIFFYYATPHDSVIPLNKFIYPVVKKIETRGINRELDNEAMRSK